jgi:Fe-S-cluster-containing dehydrogenase component/CRP-like cAMP-binding protein
VQESQTIVMRRQLHTDRWSGYGDHAGLRQLSSVLGPVDMKRYAVFDGLDDAFLEEISPDVTVADWRAGAILFEEGSYLDLAFWIAHGEVDLFLAKHETSQEPIFKTRLSPAGAIGGPGEATSYLPRDVQAAGRDGPITFLATADFDLARGDTMRLSAGDLFGEIGALNGWPQSVTARAATPCTLVQIRLPALRKLRRKAKKLRERLDALYRERTLRQHLSTTPLLRGVSEDVIRNLSQRVELVSCQPGEEITRQGETAGHLILVRSGFLKLSQAVGSGEMVVSYLSKGSLLGEPELLIPEIGTWQSTTNSVGYSELVRIPKADLFEVIRGQPELEGRLWETAVERLRETGFTRQHPHRSDLVDFALAKGLVQGNSILVLDLETCTRCDDCVRGCASTHGGVPRFVREGEKYNGFLITRSCYHCADPVCLIGCPTGAIRRANVGDVVEIEQSICIGCGTCAENCPYDAIIMHDLGEVWPTNALPERLRGQPRSAATKCDLCYKSAAGPACVSSCPHGCAHRVSTLDEFDALLRAKALSHGLDEERETLVRKRA